MTVPDDLRRFLPGYVSVPRAAGLGTLFLSCLIGWSACTSVEVVVTAPASARPVGGVAELRAPDTRVVAEILVEEGGRVDRGQGILELSSRLLDEQRRAVGQALEARREDLADTRAALSALQPGGAAAAALTPGARLQVTVHDSRLAQLDDEIGGLVSELEGARQRADAARRVLDIREQRHRAAQAAFRQGAISRFELLRLREDLLLQRAQADGFTGHVQVLLGRLSARRHARRTADGGYRRSLQTSAAELEVTVAELESRLAELDERARQSRVAAPMSGVLDQLLVSTGDFVERGEPLGVVVPGNAPVVFETRVAPAQTAFLHAGQPCRIKLDALPFARYGALECTLQSLGHDVVAVDDTPPHYVARVTPAAQGLVADGQAMRLQPGATAQVDIIAGRRTVLGFVTEPLQRFARESLRER